MLFRKLRLNWTYAISELVIVVAGVMIALAAEDWRQGRQDRALELEYVQNLIEDLQSDTAAITAIRDATRERAENAQTILSVYDTRSRPAAPTDFVRAVEYGSYFSDPAYTTTTVDDLTSTGNLRLLRSAEVKEALAQYYQEIEWTGQFRELQRPVQRDLGLYIAEFLSLEHRNATFQEGYEGQCGHPGFSCSTGIPWAPPELLVTPAEADSILDRMLRTPEARPLYAQMARIQGQHFANLTSIHQLASDALSVLEQYVRRAW